MYVVSCLYDLYDHHGNLIRLDLGVKNLWNMVNLSMYCVHLRILCNFRTTWDISMMSWLRLQNFHRNFSMLSFNIFSSYANILFWNIAMFIDKLFGISKRLLSFTGYRHVVTFNFLKVYLLKKKLIDEAICHF